MFHLDPLTSYSLSPVPWNPVAPSLLFSPVLKSSPENHKCNYQTSQCFFLTPSVSFLLFLFLRFSGRRITSPSNSQWPENHLILFSLSMLLFHCRFLFVEEALYTPNYTLRYCIYNLHFTCNNSLFLLIRSIFLVVTIAWKRKRESPLTLKQY